MDSARWVSTRAFSSASSQKKAEARQWLRVKHHGGGSPLQAIKIVSGLERFILTTHDLPTAADIFCSGVEVVQGHLQSSAFSGLVLGHEGSRSLISQGSRLRPSPALRNFHPPPSHYHHLPKTWLFAASSPGCKLASVHVPASGILLFTVPCI